MMLLRRVSVLLGFAALSIMTNGYAVQAQTADSAADLMTEISAVKSLALGTPNVLDNQSNKVEGLQATEVEPSDAPDAMTEDIEPLAMEGEAPSELVILENSQDTSNLEPGVEAGVEFEDSIPSLSDEPSMETSASVLLNAPAEPEVPEARVTTETQEIAQAVTPGRATRSGPSYIGVGGNIGLGEGDTALGEGSFAVFSKIGLTRYLSVRPAVLFSDDPTILVPLTFDFIPGVTDVTEDISGDLGLRVSPFVGAGVSISTGDDGAVDFLLTGGVDVPITSRFSLTGSVNASLFDNVAVGLLLGIGYNFPSF